MMSNQSISDQVPRHKVITMSYRVEVIVAINWFPTIGTPKKHTKESFYCLQFNLIYGANGVKGKWGHVKIKLAARIY
jgi:hypothetical protein